MRLNVFLFLGTLLLAQAGSMTEGIPYPEALEDASIAVPRLDEPINHSLLLGNGDLNGLLLAEGTDLLFRITKNDVWDARLETSLDPPLPTIARLKELAHSEWEDKNWVLPAGSNWEGPDSYHAHPYPCPRACGVVRIKNAVTDTSARLDLRTATAHAGGEDGLEAFVYAEQNVALFRCKSNAVFELESIQSEDIPPAETGSDANERWLVQRISGDLDWPGMEFAVALRYTDGRAAVAVVTSLEAPSPLEAARSLAEAALVKSSAETISGHTAVWNEFWSKSGVELSDPLLERVWYRNLYLLRCVTKEGVVSPGLFAGLLDDKPAWHGDYHTNYNIQQTFWGAYATNHIDLTGPYDVLMRDYLPRAQWLAKEVYDTGGAFYPHVIFAYEPPDPEVVNSPNGRQYLHHVWGLTLGVSAFTVQPLWWRYLYEQDVEYLDTTAYPCIKGVADFYAGFIEQCDRDDETGKVVLAPSASPEHWGWTAQFERNRNCAFDIAYAHFIFDAACTAAGILGRDEADCERWKRSKTLLPAYPLAADIGNTVVDVEDAPPMEYNIPVPATPVFPADVITFNASEETQALFRNTIANLRHNGNNAPIMLAVARARLGMEDATDWLRNELRLRERPNGTLSFNLLATRHRFNDYGHYTEMFGAVLPITELLQQSVDNVIRVFPALDESLDGSYVNLRAQGAFLVSAERKDGKVTMLTILSETGSPLALESPWPAIRVKRGNDDWQELAIDEQGMVRATTSAGEALSFQPG